MKKKVLFLNGLQDGCMCVSYLPEFLIACRLGLPSLLPVFAECQPRVEEPSACSAPSLLSMLAAIHSLPGVL